MCTVTYKDKQPDSVHQFLLVTNQIQTYEEKMHFFECLSGGRTNHRHSTLVVPFGADMSSDWGVTVSTSKTATSTTLSVVNSRQEDIVLLLEVFGYDSLPYPHISPSRQRNLLSSNIPALQFTFELLF